MEYLKDGVFKTKTREGIRTFLYFSLRILFYLEEKQA